MSKLIKNELTKIFKKKSIYITLLVILCFVILTNCIYKFSYNNTNYYYSNDYVQYMKEEIAKLDPNNPADTQMYINLKTELEIDEIAEKYDNNSWQRQVISNKINSYIYEKNTYIYGQEKNQEKLVEVQKSIDEIISRLEKDDWKYFAQQDLKIAEENIQNLEQEKINTQDKQRLKTLKYEIEQAKLEQEIAKYRIEKEIKYGNDYLNRALENYKSSSSNILNYNQNEKELNFSEKKEYNTSLKEKEISKYIIENKQDVNKIDSLKGILERFFSEYGLFLIVMVVMIAGTIVSEEFNKGTIKLLLVKPYSRNKILLSKLITVFIMIIFSIIVLILMELIVGGIILGYDSLSIPVLEYNFNTQKLESMSVFTYLGLQIITQLPIYILLATLAFSCSTLFTNGAIAIVISLLGYMSAETINILITQFEIQFMKYFVSMNWDFSVYLFGNLPRMEGMAASSSAIICLIYFAIMIIPTFIIFKKKNIKNI